MGYDDPECLLCHIIGYGNNMPDNDEDYDKNICVECFGNKLDSAY